MTKLNLIPNFLTNSDKIIHQLEYYYSGRFKSRTVKDAHEGIIPGVQSRFKTFKDTDMPAEFIDLLFLESKFDPFLKDSYSFIQVQRYEKDDYIIPHFDKYSGISKLHLITLTSSECDGLVMEDGEGGIIKIYDKAGQYIDFDNGFFHWVDPVKTTRYSVVIGE